MSGNGLPATQLDPAAITAGDGLRPPVRLIQRILVYQLVALGSMIRLALPVSLWPVGVGIGLR